MSFPFLVAMFGQSGQGFRPNTYTAGTGSYANPKNLAFFGGWGLGVNCSTITTGPTGNAYDTGTSTPIDNSTADNLYKAATYTGSIGTFYYKSAVIYSGFSGGPATGTLHVNIISTTIDAVGDMLAEAISLVGICYSTDAGTNWTNIATGTGNGGDMSGDYTTSISGLSNFSDLQVGVGLLASTNTVTPITDFAQADAYADVYDIVFIG